MDFDLIASEYARRRKIMLPVLDGLRDFVAAIGHKAAVVELGSGTGNYIIALAESTGCMAWGIDCAKGMLAQAVSRGSEVQFAIGDATKLALAADRFDLVYSVDVIHHIGPTDRLVSYYQEAQCVLKEGGRVCTVTHSEALLRSSAVLSRYFPEAVELIVADYPRIDALRDVMATVRFADIVESIVGHTVRVTNAAAYAAKAYSALNFISGKAFERGLRRLEADLATGPIHGTRRALMLWDTTR